MTPAADEPRDCPWAVEPCDRGCVASWCTLRGTFDPPRREFVPPAPRPGWFARLLATVQNRAHEESR